MSSNPKPLVLEREIETYQKELPRLLAAGQAGRFVLIKGEQVVGTWDTQAEAIQAGRERFGLEPLAVKKSIPATWSCWSAWLLRREPYAHPDRRPRARRGRGGCTDRLERCLCSEPACRSPSSAAPSRRSGID